MHVPMKLHQDDRALWNAMKAGSEAAFATLLARYDQRLFRYGYSLTPDRELIKDGLQELFLSIWRRRQEQACPEKVLPYLLSSLRRILLRRIRQDARRLVQVQPLPKEEQDEPQEYFLIQAETEETQRAYLAQKIQALPRRQREIIYLRFYQELSYPEIADVMGIKQQAAWNLLSRALKTLKQATSDRKYRFLLNLLFLF